MLWPGPVGQWVRYNSRSVERLRKAVEPAVSATRCPFSNVRRLIAVRAARAPAGLERGGDRSAGPAGGRAARGERSEPP